MIAWAAPTPLRLYQNRPNATCRRVSYVPGRTVPVARAPRRSNADAETATLEQGVLNAAGALREVCKYRVEQYPSQTELFSKACAAAEALEKTTRGFGGSGLKAGLPGRWVLLYTNSSAVIKNGGSITGLGSLPGAKCTRVEVILESSGKARTVETVTAFGLVDGENSLLGRWTLAGKRNTTLEVTYAEAQLLGKAKFRADSKAVLETTYVGDRVRVGRAPSGDLFVFERMAKPI